MATDTGKKKDIKADKDDDGFGLGSLFKGGGILVLLMGLLSMVFGGGKGGGLMSLFSGFGDKVSDVADDVSEGTKKVTHNVLNFGRDVSRSIGDAGSKFSNLASTGLAKLRDVIGLGESGGDYNRVVNVAGIKNVNLTSMTLNEVMDLQRRTLAEQKSRGVEGNSRSSALGKYQTNLECLQTVKAQMGLTGNERFDQKLQDRIFDQLVATRAVDKNGNIDASKLPNIWAGAPMENGKSRYAGVGNNQATIPLGVLKQSVAEANRDISQTLAMGKPNTRLEPTTLASAENPIGLYDASKGTKVAAANTMATNDKNYLLSLNT